MREEVQVFASLSWDAGQASLTSRHSILAFGRAASCAIRFGHRPISDLGVPPEAGQFLVVGEGRVAVENLAERLAFDVLAAGSPPDAVRPGSIFSPASSRFEVRFIGSVTSYSIHVDVRPTARRPPPVIDLGDPPEPPAQVDPELTDRQWQVMAEYIRPILAGRPVPATHATVAGMLGWSMALIRVECSEIWQHFVLAGVPMRDFPDKRDAIVDAVLRHHLLPAGHLSAGLD